MSDASKDTRAFPQKKQTREVRANRHVECSYSRTRWFQPVGNLRRRGRRGVLPVFLDVTLEQMKGVARPDSGDSRAGRRGVQLPWQTLARRARTLRFSSGEWRSLLRWPISLADISAALRVCPRTLRYSFEHVLGISPTRYLLATRLNRVRRELASTGTTSSIQCIASRAGFWHMGRFAQYYRETFGELPSQTCGQDRTEAKTRARLRPRAEPLMAAL